MKKRLFPVPLILMIPLVLLVLVIGAGIYRFSLSDEEIASQFSTSTAEPDLIARQLFGINSPNPVTLTVPETRTFAVMTQHSESDGYVSGSYDDGVERGTLALDTRFVRSVNLEAQDLAFVVITVVSNQGSGRFYYLNTLYYDKTTQSFRSVNQQLLGDRVVIHSVDISQKRVTVQLLTHNKGEAMSQIPTKPVSIMFDLSNNLILNRQ